MLTCWRRGRDLLPVVVINHSLFNVEGLQCRTEQQNSRRDTVQHMNKLIIRYLLMAVQKYLHPFYLEHKILKILKKEKLSKSLPTVENVYWSLCYIPIIIHI